MRMTELKALARECKLRSYSKLRKAELIAFLNNNENQRQTELLAQSMEPAEPGTLTRRQHKRRCAAKRQREKEFTNLTSEINRLKMQLEEMKGKISHISRLAHSEFKWKKIKSMKRDVEKLSLQIADSEAKLGSMRVRTNPVTNVPIFQHPPSRTKHLQSATAELTKKIRRAENN